ncbi:MAG: hypothetical protein UY76_C0036G0006 [Candidatus Uhrbacteria bacterium GW2011_GWA2_52_8d]|uniref:Uncharacterized protein n=1 Tax=Candidatus Uhrbacteria bacterium GW2011_GWA2_52_8d TaxID=1618979 RepID=A0A0G1XMY2_9BACT|nr:MAG: hypothetical protein UY76_C0036G0006 [Candidatus Uhrbacteria bacterium GW2011_GWA2_52_8d]
MFKFILFALALAGCGANLPWIPIHVVLVDGLSHDVEMRHWCDQDAPCTMVSRADVHWEITPDGQIRVMHIGEELRFERGFFNRPHTGDPMWVEDKKGDYLLATTPAQRALIIHYPLSE